MEKDKNIKAIFDDVCSNLVIDNNLAKKIEDYRYAFVAKNEDHLEFFGNNLTGANTVLFTSTDRDKWFSEILGVDEIQLKDRCHKIINPTFYMVASDVMNLSCVWLAHAFYRTTKMSDKQKTDAMISIFQIMQYKFLTSRMYRHWKYPTDKPTAEAVVEAMTKKYSLKVKGSWNAVLYDRAKEIADYKYGIHKDTIKKMDIDITKKGGSVAYLINDTQGRIRDMLKNIYGIFLVIHNNGVRVDKSSALLTLDGEAELKDKIKAQTTYKRYLALILPDKNSFIKQDLVDIISDANPTMNKKHLIDTLNWMSDNYQTNNNDDVSCVLDLIMTHALSYISSHKEVMSNSHDIIGLLTTMKGIYTAPRTSEKQLLEIRDKVENIVKIATKIKKWQPAIPAARTGVLMYILLRTFTMRYYSK